MIAAPEALQAQFLVTPSGRKFRAAFFDPAPGAAARGVCVLLNGQSEFIEKYFEVIDELRARGFGVATMDWHNQGASPRPLPDPLKVHVEDFMEYDEVVATVLDKLVTPVSPKPPLVLAHSMGGHILIRALHDKPDAFRAAVISAPMVAIDMRGLPNWIVGLLTITMNLTGCGTDWVVGVNTRDPLTDKFEGNPVTSDKARWDRSHDFLRAHPGMRVIGPTWAWLRAAWRSMRAMATPAYARRITIPTLIFGAGIDRICLTPATRAFAKNLPSGRYIELTDSRHEILMERDDIRTQFWKEFDAFVGHLT